MQIEGQHDRHGDRTHDRGPRLRAALGVVLVAVAVSTPSVATAWEEADEEHAQYLDATGRPLEAAALARDALERDPRDLQAHWRHVDLWIRELWYAEETEVLYRQWYEEEPDDEVRRLALARVLERKNWKPGPWCEEAEQLLDGVGEDPSVAYHAALLRHAMHDDRCPGDREQDREAIQRAAEDYPPGSAYATFRRMRDGEITSGVARDLRAMVRAQPEHLRYLDHLWRDGATGDGLERARRDAVAAARRGLRAERPAVVHAALDVLLAAGEDELAVQARGALEALDPAWDDEASDPEVRALYKAVRRSSPDKALEDLEQLAADLPADAEARVLVHQQRARLLEQLERHDESFEALAAAYEAAPEDPAVANQFAYTAALRDEQLEQALVAADTAVEAVRAEEYVPRRWGANYDAWRESHLRERAAFLDTRAWVLHRLGRHDEAAAAGREALTTSAQPVMLIHQGLIHAARGDDLLAATYLAEGLAGWEEPEGGAGQEAATMEAAREALRARADVLPLWGPDGIEAAVEAWGPVDDEDDTGNDDEDEEDLHPLVGAPLPMLPVEVDGEIDALGDSGSLVVLELWATWCGPCRASLRHLAELAEQYRDQDVLFLAVSLDAEEDAVETYFEGDDPPPFVLGRGPRSIQEDLGVSGIPATFVVQSGTVVGVVSGFDPRGGDRRLDDLLERALANPSLASELRAGEADPRVAALMQRVAEFDALLLPGTTDDAVLQEAIERKARMAAVIADEAASLAGDPETAQAGRYVEALLADHMGVAIRAWHPAMPARFPDTPEGRSEFLALVEEQRDVLATPFEIRAVELYSAVVEADGDEGEGCPWAARARDALARLQR